MVDSVEAATTWEITGARHAGITVSDLERSLEFYSGLLGLELLWRRLYEEPDGYVFEFHERPPHVAA